MIDEAFKPSFKNLDRDIERYLDKFGDWDYSGMTPMVRGYDKAMRGVFDAYVEHEAYDAIVHYLLVARTYEQGLNDYFWQVSDLLRQEGQVNRLKRLWHGAIAAQKSHFWELHAYARKTDVEKSLEEARQLVLGTMRQFRDILMQFDQRVDVERLDQDIAAIEEGRRRLASGKPDDRQMDDALFWHIIEEARQGTSTVAEQVETITRDLEALRGPQIKKFDKLLEERMAEAMHWDIWALAFVAQDGCSDDAFEAFRAWLILQGRAVFRRAVADIDQVLGDVPAGLETSGEALLSAAPVAYEARAAKPLKRTARPVSPLKGKAWDENDVASRYPALVRHFADLRA